MPGLERNGTLTVPAYLVRYLHYIIPTVSKNTVYLARAHVDGDGILEEERARVAVARIGVGDHRSALEDTV